MGILPEIFNVGGGGEDHDLVWDGVDPTSEEIVYETPRAEASLSGHDVSGEKRDEEGKWTVSGSIKSFMEKIKSEAIARRHGEHGRVWEVVRNVFTTVKKPVFHVTGKALQIMNKGFISGGDSRFGRGNMNSISMTSNLDWAVVGQGRRFGRYVFVADENTLDKYGKLRDHQASDTDDYEFERRFEGSVIPPSEIKGLVVAKHMGRMEKEEAAEWPLRVVYEDKDKGWVPLK